MPVIDYDMGLARKVGDLYSSPGIPVEFMPEELFERKRIVDKLMNKETFSFLSFWRSGYVFDPNRWDPSMMFENNFGYYNDPDMNSATLFNVYPVIFDYNFIFWDTKREQLDYYSTILFKNLYKSGPIMTTMASDAPNLQLNCYMDFDYKLNVTDEYVLEKSEKVPYFKGKFDVKLEGWLYDIVDTGDSGSSLALIKHVHSFTYNENNFYMGEQWIVTPAPSPESGLPLGEPSDEIEQVHHYDVMSNSEVDIDIVTI